MPPSPPTAAAAPLRDAFRCHLDTSGLLAGAGALVAACSGGSDSTALLVLLAGEARRRGLPLVGFHVDHQLRDAEGHRDARAAADLAASLGLPFVFRSFPVRELRRPGESLESAARRLRYESLLALGRDLGAGALLATGHTLEDQAETVLLHLERRLGRARGGIRARRADGVVRPLLPFRRAELRAFLVSEGVAWREDASNEDERFARNRVRARLLPALEARWPGATTRLARAGEAWNRRLDTLDERIARSLAAAGAPPGGPWPGRFWSRSAPRRRGASSSAPPGTAGGLRGAPRSGGSSHASRPGSPPSARLSRGAGSRPTDAPSG